MECCQLNMEKCLIALWRHLTLTFKFSVVNLIKVEIPQLNEYFKGPEKEGKFAIKMEDVLFDNYSLDHTRFTETVI